jgi:hypothetical protein
LGIYEPKREQVTKGWRKLHNKKLHNMYSLLNFITIRARRIRWAGHVANMGEMRSPYKIMVANTLGNRPFERHSSSWEDIKINLTERL